MHPEVTELDAVCAQAERHILGPALAEELPAVVADIEDAHGPSVLYECVTDALDWSDFVGDRLCHLTEFFRSKGHDLNGGPSSVVILWRHESAHVFSLPALLAAILSVNHGSADVMWSRIAHRRLELGMDQRLRNLGANARAPSATLMLGPPDEAV